MRSAAPMVVPAPVPVFSVARNSPSLPRLTTPKMRPSEGRVAKAVMRGDVDAVAAPMPSTASYTTRLPDDDSAYRELSVAAHHTRNTEHGEQGATQVTGDSVD
jgi:hypothetical protein